MPASLERVLKSSLEKDPNKRFPDARTFREALENLRFDSDNTQAGTQRAQKKSQRGSSRARAVAMGLGLGVAVVGGMARLGLRPHGNGVTVPPQPSPATVASQPPRPSWPAPYALRDLSLAVDQTFDSDKLRIQSAAARDLTRLRERIQETNRLLKDFLAGSQVVGARLLAAHFAPAPLTVTVVPPGLLSRPELWPGFGVEAGKTYGSRYVEPKKTLFVADAPGFERRELAYGMALHVLAPEKALTNDECLDWRTSSRPGTRPTPLPSRNAGQLAPTCRDGSHLLNNEGWHPGSEEQATGDRRQATGDRRQATGDRRQATGDRRQATGDARTHGQTRPQPYRAHVGEQGDVTRRLPSCDPALHCRPPVASRLSPVQDDRSLSDRHCPNPPAPPPLLACPK